MKTQTKDKIFDTALDLFSKKGYDSVSVRTIASEVGIKESSIYIISSPNSADFTFTTPSK